MAKARTLLHITIGRVEIALNDLLSPKRLSALKSSPYGMYIVDELIQLRDKIAALPANVKSKPFAGDLADLDKTHDGFGAACWYLVEAYLRAPDTTPDQRKALLDIRDVLGVLDDITGTYDVEAQLAQKRNAKLGSINAAMASFPVAGGKTMTDWAQGYVGAGISIGKVLSDRADAKDRALASLLRSETIGVLNETRRQIARAMKKDATLPATLDKDVFAFFDELEETSAEEAAAEKKAAAEAKKKAAGAGPAAGATGGAGPAAGATGGAGPAAGATGASGPGGPQDPAPTQGGGSSGP